MIPDDLAERWHLTDWSLARNDWALHIALCVYPPPECFERARAYEAKLAEVRAIVRPAPKVKKKREPPKEQLELW